MDIHAPVSIETGILGSLDAARALLVAAEVSIDPEAEELLLQVTFAAVPQTFLLRAELAVQGRSRYEVTAGEICPPEVALCIWLQQPTLLVQGRKLLLAMEPIRTKNGGNCVFCLEEYCSERWLWSFDLEKHHVRPEYYWLCAQ